LPSPGGYDKQRQGQGCDCAMRNTLCASRARSKYGDRITSNQAIALRN
jgi:hypothetical protein